MITIKIMSHLFTAIRDRSLSSPNRTAYFPKSVLPPDTAAVCLFEHVELLLPLKRILLSIIQPKNGMTSCERALKYISNTVGTKC